MAISNDEVKRELATDSHGVEWPNVTRAVEVGGIDQLMAGPVEDDDEPSRGELLTREDCGCEYRECPCESRSCPTGGVVFDFCALHEAAPAMRAALQILADTGSGEVEEIARRAIGATEPGYAPRVLVTVRDGLVSVSASLGVEVRTLDYDVDGLPEADLREIDDERCYVADHSYSFDGDAEALWRKCNEPLNADTGVSEG